MCYNDHMEYTVIKSKRKSISIEITPECEVIVRAPLRCGERTIREFIYSRTDWIEATLEKQKKRQESLKNIPKLTDDEVAYLKSEAKKLFPERVKYYSEIIGVDYGRITIRNQSTRWGSCSSKGNLNFNYMLMLAPSDVLDYVVVHELCHRLEMNHSEAFWSQVSKVCPDYKAKRQWLKKEGPRILNMQGS